MKQNLRKWTMAASVVAIMSIGCSKNSNPSTSPDILPNSIILEWDETSYEAFGGTAYQHSLMASRINAMVHLAMHDALNSIQEKYQRYAYLGKDVKADPITAAASAAHAVLLHELPLRKPFLDSALNRSLQDIENQEARDRGIALGKAAAMAVIEKRKNDGAEGELMVHIPPSAQPGVYQAVPPFNIMFVPHWKDVKPFALNSSDQFRCAPQPALNSAAYTAAFNEVKSVGKMNSTTRTAAQTAYAMFWYEFSEAGWNRIARKVAASKKLSLIQTARLFALVDMAMADAYIAGWDSKLHYNFWRPYTAIRNAGSDMNDATMADTSWEPSAPTPPIHDYPSTHSALGKAAATVMALILGDETTFTFSSPTALPGTAARTFSSFSEAAAENADSRVMAGIHFRFSCDAGLLLGQKIGEWTVSHHLKPL